MNKIELKDLDETIYTDMCENGLRIYVWVNERQSAIYGSYVVKCGSEDIQFSVGKNHYQVPMGTSHYLEHYLCKRGTDNSVLSMYNSLGAYSNAATYSDKTVYEFLGVENLKECIHLLLDWTQFSIFDEESFQLERNAILEEARMQSDNIDRLRYYEIRNSVFSHYPNRIIGLGTQEDILNIQLNDLETLYRTFYHPKNSFVIITGKVDPLEVIQIIKDHQNSKKFSSYILPKLHSYKEPKKVVRPYYEIQANVEVPEVEIAFKIPKKNFEFLDDILLFHAFHLLLESNFGNTSLFKDECIQKKLVVSLGAWVMPERDYLLVEVVSRTKYPEEFLKVALDKLYHLDICEEDIERKKKSAIANLVLGYEDVEVVANGISYSIVKYNRIIDNEKEYIESVHGDLLRKILEKISWKEKAVLVIRPMKKDE